MPVWEPEIVVDEGLARRLIGGQFAELRLGSVRLIGEGWDNTVWLVDERWAFRFPRRTTAIPGVEREIAVLPALAPRLPLPIPAPVFAGRPADGYPWPFFGAAHLPGGDIPGAALSAEARMRLAAPFAEFLRALHAPEVAAAVDGLPVDPMGRGEWRSACRRLSRASPTWSAPGSGTCPRPSGGCSKRPATCRSPSPRSSRTATCTSGTCSWTTTGPRRGCSTGATSAAATRRSTCS